MPVTTSQSIASLLDANLDARQIGSLATFTVELDGELPNEMTNSHIPLTIIATVSSQFARFVRPVLKCQVQEVGSGKADDGEVLEKQMRGVPVNDYPVSFMPLPLGFDHHLSSSWALLAKRIQVWLCEIVDNRNHPQWEWGLDLFWIAFVAAHPTFPFGPNFPTWNADIPLQGSFIDEWLRERGVNESSIEGDDSTIYFHPGGLGSECVSDDGEFIDLDFDCGESVDPDFDDLWICFKGLLGLFYLDSQA